MNFKIAGSLTVLFGWLTLTSFLFAQNPDYAIIPFQRTGKLIYISALVNDRVGNFIIDTGYSGILLNSQYYEGVKSNKVLYGVNGKVTKVQAKTVDLNLGGVGFPATYTEVADLAAIETSSGIMLHGLIGGNLFKEHEIMLDYAKGQLTLFPLDRKSRKTGQPLSYTDPTDTINMTWKGHLPCIEVKVGAKRFKFALDNGAGSNVLSNKNLGKVDPYLKNRKEVTVRSFGHKKESATVGMLTELSIGDIECQPMPTIIKNILELNKELPGFFIDGIIGYEFFRRYKVAFNFRKQEVYVWRGSGKTDGSSAETLLELAKN